MLFYESGHEAIQNNNIININIEFNNLALYLNIARSKLKVRNTEAVEQGLNTLLVFIWWHLIVLNPTIHQLTSVYSKENIR